MIRKIESGSLKKWCGPTRGTADCSLERFKRAKGGRRLPRQMRQDEILAEEIGLQGMHAALDRPTGHCFVPMCVKRLQVQVAVQPQPCQVRKGKLTKAAIYAVTRVGYIGCFSLTSIPLIGPLLAIGCTGALGIPVNAAYDRAREWYNNALRYC